MQSGLSRRNTHKVSHLLADDLRRQILRGELEVGEQLPPEADLTSQYHVSRDTLREALRILESQSLLEVRRGRGGGAVVRRPGLDAVARYVGLLLQLRNVTLNHIGEARSVVEPPVAELVPLHYAADDLNRLVGLHEAAQRAEGDALSFVTAVAAFDQAMIEMSGNRTLGVIAGVFQDLYAGQVYAAIGRVDSGERERIARRVVAGHEAFLDALRRKDAPLAGRAWRDYLLTTSRMLVSRTTSRQPIDMTPLWRARAADTTTGTHPRRSIVVSTEIRSRIAEGKLRDGDRLPPLADLAAEFQISRPTLREALRILEMEFLVDLRAGDRSGARIREPSTQIAAQLVGIVLESRQTTLKDFHRGMRLVQPGIVRLVAVRAGKRTLAQLHDLAQELAASVDDTPRFVDTFRGIELTLFSASKNPALTIIAEIMHWVGVAVGPGVAADATALPWVSKTNRKAQARIAELIRAMRERDADAASDVWNRYRDVSQPFLEESELGARLIIDLLG